MLKGQEICFLSCIKDKAPFAGFFIMLLKGTETLIVEKVGNLTIPASFSVVRDHMDPGPS